MNIVKKLFLIALIFLLIIVSPDSRSEEQSAREKYQANLFISDLKVPWGMVQLPDGSFLVTEREGKLLHISADGESRKEVSGLPEIISEGQGGLLDIELDPDFNSNKLLYLSLSSPIGETEGSNTAIIRGEFENNKLSNLKVLYKASPNTNSRHHFGSRIEFDRDGKLFFSIGDRGARDQNPQDLKRDGGKIYRINADGSIPKDNPFVSTEKPAIYSYGHRNPQGMAMNPKTGKIWAHEHGPRGGDEINIIEPGKNYGWPVISYGINYNGTKFTELTEKEGMEQPAWYWDPSIAPSGMVFVTSDKYPEYKGKLIVGSLKFGYLVLLEVEDQSVKSAEIILEGIGRVRNVRQMNDGYLYIAVDGQGIKRLEP
ncbi:MAG: PQQ-dependent sugar dehydrogenase [Gammaproteobacteria bacterium]|nr:PQQ-dependent sugar dehydrogenase [Gammaproteobacteria bacterium]